MVEEAVILFIWAGASSYAICILNRWRWSCIRFFSRSRVPVAFLTSNNPIMLCFGCISNPLSPSTVVWTAASAMTATKPTLAASPASPTALHLSPGATASPVLVCKPAMRLPQLAAAICRASRPRPNTPLKQCPLAAPAVSTTRHAASSSKAWTLEMATSSLVTWVILMYFARALMTTTMTTIWPMGECLFAKYFHLSTWKRWLHWETLWRCS